jgi:hypothetical protein
MSKHNAKIIPSGNGFAVAVDGKIIRDGFTGPGHAAMWAARQGIYQGKAYPSASQKSRPRSKMIPSRRLDCSRKCPARAMADFSES